MAPEQGAVYDEFVASGLLDDADVLVKSARWEKWNYNGAIKEHVLALRLDMVDLKDADSKVHEEHLSCGELRFFVPSADGKRAIPVGNQTKLNINTNAVAFIVSLMNADTRGEMAAKLRSTDDISIVDNIRIHIERKAQPKRAGIVAPELAAGQQAQAKTRVEATKVLGYPWEGAAAGAAVPAGATQTGSAVAAAPAGNGAALVGPVDTAAAILLNIVSGNNGSIKKTAIAGKAFGMDEMKALDAPTRNSILGLIVKDEFFASAQVAAFGIVYDKASGTVSLGG